MHDKLTSKLEDITRSLDEGFSIDGIHLDYSKAYDTVSYRRLTNKMYFQNESLQHFRESTGMDRKIFSTTESNK